MGDATLEPTAIHFGTVGDLVNVINNSSFGTDRFPGFRSAVFTRDHLWMNVTLSRPNNRYLFPLFQFSQQANRNTTLNVHSRF